MLFSKHGNSIFVWEKDMPTCPLHKIELVFEERTKHKLVCTNKNCSHVEYTSKLNPNNPRATALPFWCSKN